MNIPAPRGLNLIRYTGLQGLLAAFCALLIAGCASRSYTPEDVGSTSFLDRKITQVVESVRVTAAVPDAGETQTLFGLPLYDKGVQPVWLEIENTGTTLVRLSIWSVDPDYYSPLEVAWLNRGGYSKDDQKTMERWFHEHGIERRIPAGESRSGFIFTHKDPGTKGFNVDLISAKLNSYSFTFFVSMPGFTADYMAVDFEGMYADDEISEVDFDGLRKALEDLPCCSTEASGTQQGPPLNVLLIGTGTAVRRALMRANWQETRLGAAETTVARLHHYRGRRPDGTFTKARADGSERKELRLWLTPIRIGDDRVWLGQTGIVVVDSKRNSARTMISSDIDAPAIYLMQDFWYRQSLQSVGFVKGSEPAPPEAPRSSFTGYAYYTNGQRAVLWLSEDPIGLDEVVNLEWEQLQDE